MSSSSKIVTVPPLVLASNLLWQKMYNGNTCGNRGQFFWPSTPVHNRLVDDRNHELFALFGQSLSSCRCEVCWTPKNN